MLARIESRVLSVLYSLALIARSVWWRIRRPLLMGVRVLVVDGDKVLLVRHRSGRRPWSIPGGGVERNEPLAVAAARECFEEAGVRVRIESSHGVYDNFMLGLTNYIAVFVAQPLGPLAKRRSLEVAEARYFPFAALPADLERGSAQRIEEFRSGSGMRHGVWYRPQHGE